MHHNIGVFANDEVGNKTIKFLLQNYPDDVKFVVCTDEKSLVYQTLLEYNLEKSKIIFNDELQNENVISKLISYKVNFILLAWWPYKIKEPILSIPLIGVLNFHPSLLPYNRGKNYNFWTIVEDSPFGVSIHFIDEKIDTGDIVFQRKIKKDWTDTGETLYKKASETMLNLFYDKYKEIREQKFNRISQDKTKGSFRWAKEMALASKIELNSTYTARELLNLLRAKSFPPHPGIWFEENGEKYEVLINIKKI